MRVVIENKLKIEGCPDNLKKKLNRMLSFDNPEYQNRQKMGLWCGDIPRKLSLMEKRGKDIFVPYGVLKELENMPEFENAFFQETKSKVYLPHYDYMSHFTPFDYQEKAIQAALDAGFGVVVAPCGSGKTNIGLELCARLGYRALWLTHTGDLLTQSINRAKSLFDMSEEVYGTITGGKVDVGEVITFATVQTMSKIDLSELKDYFDIIIVDECHRVAGTPTKMSMFYKVISALNAPYKYGLTATPYRSDGLIGCMFALLGNVCHTIPLSETSCNTCPTYFRAVYVPFNADVNGITQTDGTLNWSKLVNALCADVDRTNLIVRDVKSCIDKENRCLVLTDRVAHAKQIAEMLGKDAVPLVGSVGKTKRADTLAKLNSGKIKCVCATYQLAKEGLDVPALEYVFFATPQKNQTTVEQSAGRVGRAADGKLFGCIVDYVDSFGMLVGWHKKRKTVYKRIGAKEYD